MLKKYKQATVYEAGWERLDFVYTHFSKVYVSFSGGKDSGLMLNMAIEVARKHNKLPVHVLIVDLEAQYTNTIDYIQRMVKKPEVNAYWVCLPLHLRNAVSQYQPHWICWDKDKRDAWIRNYPEHPSVINDPGYFPFFKTGMGFEEFVLEFGKWFSAGENTACLVGIRTDESYNRYRTITNFEKARYRRKQWSTRIAPKLYNFYPIYDWGTRDIWIANGKFDYDLNIGKSTAIKMIFRKRQTGSWKHSVKHPHGEESVRYC